MRRKIALVMTLLMTAFAMSSTGCIGRMALTGQVMKFNLGVTEDKWGRATVYLILYIIPVYEFAALIDVLVINSIEFHSGENPLSGETRLAKRTIELPSGARGESMVRADGTFYERDSVVRIVRVRGHRADRSTSCCLSTYRTPHMKTECEVGVEELCKRGEVNCPAGCMPTVG